MPTYHFRDINTGEETEEFMKISELDEFKEKNPHLQQFITGAPALGDPMRLGLRKPDQGFRDVLSNVKSHHKGSRTIKSGINTWYIMPRITTSAHSHVGHASPTPNPFHVSSYVAGQDKVEAGGNPVIRQGDATGCGDPAVGCSSKVRAVGAFVHRFGDATGGHGSWVPNSSGGGVGKVEVGT